MIPSWNNISLSYQCYSNWGAHINMGLEHWHLTPDSQPNMDSCFKDLKILLRLGSILGLLNLAAEERRLTLKLNRAYSNMLFGFWINTAYFSSIDYGDSKFENENISPNYIFRNHLWNLFSYFCEKLKMWVVSFHWNKLTCFN